MTDTDDARQEVVDLIRDVAREVIGLGERMADAAYRLEANMREVDAVPDWDDALNLRGDDDE